MIDWNDASILVPENSEGKWSEEVLCLADNYEFYRLSHMGDADTGVWQRTKAFIDQGATRVLFWSHINWPE